MKNQKNLFKKKLEELKKTETNKLKKHIINYILDYYKTDEEIKGFVDNLLKHGCISGLIGELIYYTDTTKFYNKYEDEIEDLIYETQEAMGYKNRFEFISSLNGADNVGDMTQEKNLLSWFAFEETTRNIYINDLKQEW